MARMKSDEKRREIVRVAAQAFQELGYERTSMLTIAERLRGSKQTLYNYFPSKEDLLRAVLAFDVGEVAEKAMGIFFAEPDIQKALAGLGQIYLERQLTPLAIANIRTVSTQPAESGIGGEFYRNVLCAAWKRLADAFEVLMSEGKLRRADPWLAAMHFKGLILQDLLERYLLGAATAIDQAEVAAAAQQAAEAFLMIYGPLESVPEARSLSPA